MTETNAAPVVRGLLDTSVVIALEELSELLPEEPAIAAVTLAELAAGPHATGDDQERARRQDRLQRIEALMDPLRFDAGAARATAGSTPPREPTSASLAGRGRSTC